MKEEIPVSGAEEAFVILFKHIEEKITLSLEEKQQVKGYFNLEFAERKSVLLKQTSYCRKLRFVCSGILRSYSLDVKGVEHISLFGWEGWWISDFESFIFDKPASMSIDAVQSASILSLNRSDYEQLLERVPKMERYFRILYQNSLATKDKRLLSANEHSAEEKYRFFLSNYPKIAPLLPQQMIASYLGISPETISRIKRKLVKK